MYFAPHRARFCIGRGVGHNNLRQFNRIPTIETGELGARSLT
jgi:hypothetical protein